MKIVIAWSKDASGAIGNALHNWLADISPKFTPIISKQDIRGGNVWRTSLGEEEISDKFNSSYQELADKIQAILDGAEETRIREKLNEFDEALKDFYLSG